MDYRSPSREERNNSRSPTPASRYSASPSSRRRRYSSASPPPANAEHNGSYRSDSRSVSRGRTESRSPLRGSTKIVVEKLSKTINEDHLYEIFGSFGTIRDLDLPMSRQFGTNRGTAYILYVHEDDAFAAISSMHEANVDGAIINVSIAQASEAAPDEVREEQELVVELGLAEEALDLEAPEAVAHLHVTGAQAVTISIPIGQGHIHGLGRPIHVVIVVAQIPMDPDPGRLRGAAVVEEIAMMIMVVTVSDVAVSAMTAIVAVAALTVKIGCTDNRRSLYPAMDKG
ncbi:RNA-binding domain-containing protein [Xylaria nigripes]|nr:RNA-binding domain-containing protein [Xylaria nigripes]